MRVYVKFWFVLFALAFGNGAVRALWYGPLIGEPWAHHLSVVTGSLVLGIAVWICHIRWPFTSRRRAALVGMMWLLMTEVFEWVMITGFMGKASTDFLDMHDLLRGNSWPIFLIWIALLPSLVYRWKRKGAPSDLDREHSPFADQGLDAKGKRLMLLVYVLILFHGILLFLSSWNVEWSRAWLFLGVEVTFFSVEMWLIALANPAVINARARRHQDSESFDKIILRTHSFLILGLFVSAGLDAGYFQYSHVPDSLRTLALFMILVGASLVTWALIVNPFFETTVRFQKEREHTVITDGPYQWIRHPGYAASILLFVGYALFLGSWVALLFALMASLNMCIRIVLEERVLNKKLHGYVGYTQEVHYRILPKIW